MATRFIRSDPAIGDWASLHPHLQAARALHGDDGPARVRAWIAAEAARVGDAAFGARFGAHLARTGLPAEAFSHRLIRCEGLTLLGGIRFLGGDPAQPFIELIAWDGVDAALSPAGWRALEHLVAEAWRAFEPRRFRALIRADAPLPPGGDVDLTVHAAPYAAMAAHAAASTEPRLERFDDVEAAAALAAARYRTLAAADPALGAAIAPASRAELQESADADGLFEIRVGAARAGLLAVAPGAIAWLEGEVVLEEVVLEVFAGRGLAAAAQGLLAARRERGRLLIGTIDRRNIASRRTAEKAGRPALLRYAFAPITL